MEWDRILDLAVVRGLLPSSRAREASAKLRTESTLADAAEATGLTEAVLQELLGDASTVPEPPVLPSTRLLPRDGSPLPTDAGAALADALLQPGPELKQIGKYEIREKYASGGMGIVYRAFDPDLRREVAIKEIKHISDESDAIVVERFRREARSAARLRHPGIVSIHEQGVWDGRPFFAMDFVKGKSFAQALADGMLTGLPARPAPDDPTVVVPHGTPRDAPPRSRLPLREALGVLVEVGEALGYAHGQGVFHRDLKPGNILLDAEGHAHVTDFGLAKDLSASDLTMSGEAFGTPGYMSPEQAEGRRNDVGPPTDVFALGVMLYEALTGRLPFAGDSWAVIKSRTVGEDPPLPRRIDKSVPRDLETICLKALEKRPERRYPNGKEFADDLRRWLGGEPILARPPSCVQRAVRWLRRRPRAIAAAIGLLAAVGLLTAWLIYGAWRERAAWVLVYDQGQARDFASDWMPAVGIAGEDGLVWHPDPANSRVLVAEPTPQQALLVLVRRLPSDVRIEYDVWQDGDPPGDLGCFLSSDPRGWEFSDPVAKNGSGYFTGVASDGGKRVKVLGEAMEGKYHVNLVQDSALSLVGAREWRHVTVERRGATLRVWVGAQGTTGSRVIEWTDPRPIPENAEHGYCGLYKWQHGYRYRGIRVWARNADAEESRLSGVFDRSWLDFDHGRYSEHQRRLRSVLPSLDAHPSLRSEALELLAHSTELLAYSSASTSDLRDELELSYRAWIRDPLLDGGSSQGLVRAAGGDARSLLAMLDRMRTLPGIDPGKARRYASRKVEVHVEAGQWLEGFQELGADGTTGQRTFSSSSKSLCLLGQGKWEAAVANLADDPAWQAIVEADRGQLTHARELVSCATAWPPNYDPALALVYEARAGSLPCAIPAAIDDPYALAKWGMCAARDGDPSKIAGEWTRIAAAGEMEAVDPDHPRIRDDRDRIPRWVQRRFCDYLAGRGTAEAADRFRRTATRPSRIWLDLAMAIRAEADGDKLNARRFYQFVRQDDIGLLLPQEWAEAGLKRLGK